MHLKEVLVIYKYILLFKPGSAKLRPVLCSLNIEVLSGNTHHRIFSMKIITIPNTILCSDIKVVLFSWMHIILNLKYSYVTLELGTFVGMYYTAFVILLSK